MIVLTDDLAGNAVTAGIPSLSPEKRAGITKQQRMVLKRDTLIAEAQQKKNQAAAKDGDRSRTIKDASGWWIDTQVFFARLQRLTKSLYFQPTNGFKDRISIYRITNDPEQPLLYLAAVHSDKIPEFSVFDKDTHTVKYMGWRTVLLRLITAKLITQSAVETTFGPPRASSRNWQKLFSW